MYPLPRDKSSEGRIHADVVPRCWRCAPTSRRCGLTLVELTIAMAITSMLTVILGGLTLAVQTAREHTEGLQDAVTLAQATTDRIQAMVAEAGVYQISGTETTLGLAVIPHESASIELPDTLVIWSGGRNGGLAAAGVQQRLPRLDELIVYTPSPTDPSQLVEVAFPLSSSSIDFRAVDFASTILALLPTTAAEQILLCDRIRISLPTDNSGSTVTGNSLSGAVSNVRFELEQTPSDAELASTVPGTASWNALSWAQGIVSGSSGFRQATLRIEIQIEPRTDRPAGSDQTPIAVPFFGSASYRYVYQP